MNATKSELPSGFEPLERFAAGWAIPSADDRLRRRLSSSEAERVAFFEAAKDLVAPALDHLDRKPINQFDADEQRLMNLMLTFAHIALAVETLGEDEPQHAQSARHITITRAPADL